MKKTALAYILCILVLILAACQPTPDKPPVVRKDDLGEKILETQSSSEKNEYPNSWVQDFQNDDGAVTIKIDAPLEIPNVSTYPVIEVVSADISEDDIERLVDYFFDGKPVYEGEEDSRAFINNLIQQYKLSLKTLEESGKVHYAPYVFTPEEIPDEKARIESVINFEENKLSTFEDIPRNISNLELTTIGDYSTCTLVDTVSGYYTKKLYISKVDGNYETRITYLKVQHSGYDFFEEPPDEGEKPQGMDIKLDEAESLAKATLAGIGIENAMRVDWFIGNYKGFAKEITGIDNSEQCYVLYFCRPVSGVPITYVYDYEGTTMYESFSYPWHQEEIQVYVNNHGVVSLMWSNADTLTETINENVKLLPWEEIKERATQQFRMKKIEQYMVAGLTDEVSINIDRITLGMMRIAKKNTLREYMYIPVWDFFGNYNYQQKDHRYAERACSMLTINAIDGSIIDRGLGY